MIVIYPLGSRKGGTILAAAARWTPATVRIYGRDQDMSLADITCLWYGCLDTRTVRVILARSDIGLLALVSTDLTAGAQHVAASSAPSRSRCSPTPWSSPGMPGTATTRPASPPADPRKRAVTSERVARMTEPRT